MKIITGRFGEMEVEDKNILSFDSGLLAFEKLTRYILLDIPQISNFKWLQSTENPDLAFLLVDPFSIKNDYYIEISDEIVETLGISAPEDVLAYTIVTVPPQGFKDATTNLVGPLIINWTKKKAKQIIFDNENNSIKYPLLADSSKKMGYGG